MRSQSIRSLALLGSVSFAAANDIVSLILPLADDQGLNGKVVGTNGAWTTYVIDCPPGTDSLDCGMPSGGLTYTAEPTAFVFEYGYDDYYLSESCKHSGTTYVSCKVTNSQSDFSMTTSTDGSIDLPYVPVTITATATGVDVDDKSSATSTPTTTATSSAGSDSDSDDDSSTTLSNSASVTAQPADSASPTTSSEADPEETNSDNAAMPLATGATAQWLVSGAGMAIALALA
ncbi:hypothetical protein BDV18DRAFT_47688 [Aspergillus unguis]